MSYYRRVKVLFGNDPQVDIHELIEVANGHSTTALWSLKMSKKYLLSKRS